MRPDGRSTAQHRTQVTATVQLKGAGPDGLVLVLQEVRHVRDRR